MKIKRNCLLCKKAFYIEISRLKYGRGKCCSTICQYKHRCGTKMSEDSKKKISKAQKKYHKEHPEARIATGQRFKGYKHTLEARMKMSQSHKGQTPSTKGKENKKIQGANHYNWRGGRIKQSSGYIWQYVKNHPCTKDKKRKYILEHRLVMEKHLKRHLTEEERIHHINGIKSDNSINNLMLFPSESAHQKFHQSYLRI